MRSDRLDHSTGTTGQRPGCVSIVIPVAGSAPEIGVQLASIARQDYEGQVEVIVSDNGMSPSARDVVAAFTEVLPGLRVVDAKGSRGAAHARNTGAGAATGDVLLFVDADDELDQGYVRALARALEEHTFVTGRLDVQALNGDLPREYVDRAEQPELPTSFGHLPFAAGCSLGVRRRVFEDVGGFDETIHHSEDVDFSWRVQYSGIPLVRIDDAVLRYRLRPTFRAVYRQGYGHAEYLPLIYTKHRMHGMPRRSARTAVRHILGIGPYALRARSRGDLLNVAYMLGARLGRIRGSIRHRIAYL